MHKKISIKQNKTNADSMSWARDGGYSTAEYHDLVFIC